MSLKPLTYDPGSFRDPSGSVFLIGKSVYRSISKNALPNVKNLLLSDFFKKNMDDGHIIPTKLVLNKFDIPGRNLLQHEKIDFITYPYEWSFHMLKDAALLTLNIMKDCLQNGFVLKDGTAWNLTYYKGRMIFFDVLSIDAYEEGQSWDGYQQFCTEFLYPLFIKAYKNIDFQQIFKGSLLGIDPMLVRKCFKITDILKPGIFKHVFLNSMLLNSKKVASTTLKNKLKLPKSALLGIIASLINVITHLKPNDKQSLWIDYTKDNTYTDIDESKKIKLIKDFSDSCPINSKIIDLGCNTGHYSLLAAKSHNVISADIDSNCIDNLYKKIVLEHEIRITPVVLNLMNPSSNSGWHLKERKSIFERIRVDYFFSLALMHHICIAHNVPIERFVQFLQQIAGKGILEWVDKKDPMVQFLLRNRTDIFHLYNWKNFKNIISKYFAIKKVVTINNGTRRLLWLENLR